MRRTVDRVLGRAGAWRLELSEWRGVRIVELRRVGHDGRPEPGRGLLLAPEDVGPLAKLLAGAASELGAEKVSASN